MLEVTTNGAGQLLQVGCPLGSLLYRLRPEHGVQVGGPGPAVPFGQTAPGAGQDSLGHGQCSTHDAQQKQKQQQR